MSNISRLSLLSARNSLFAASVLGGALLLSSPLSTRAQDAPQAPATQAPATQAPATQAPATQAPATQAPATQAPATQAPATQAPVAANSAAWTTFKGNLQRTGESASAVGVPLSLQWRYSSIGPGRNYTTAPLVIGAPGSQRVIFATGNVLYATDVDSGAQVWASPESTSTFVVPLALLSTDDGDLILGLQSSGILAAFKASTGARAWEIDCGALATESGPMVATTNGGTRILCALNNGRIVAVTPQGAIDKDWKVQLGAIGNSAASSMALSKDGSRLFITGSDSRLHVVNVAESRVMYSIPQTSRSAVTPVVGSETVYTANARIVAGWNIRNGQPAWTITPKGDVVSSPALKTNADGTDDTLFVGTSEGEFMAVDAKTGTIKWQKALLDNVSVTGSPIVLPSMVLVGTQAGTLIGFDPADGNIVWQYRLQTERPVDLTPTRRGRRGRRGRGGRGGGDFGGGRGGDGRGGDGRAGDDSEKRSYGISSAPAAIDGKVFVLGDNAALYAFTSTPFDADPPRVLEPSIALNTKERELVALLLKPDKPQLVPGVGPFYFAAQIDDVGSGINPDSITVSINDKPLEAARVFYGRASGVLTVTLVDPAKDDPTLTDGLKKVVVTAKDYAGNTVNFNINFLVDNTAPAPTDPEEERRGGRGGDFGGRGGGDFGGRGGGRRDR